MIGARRARVALLVAGSLVAPLLGPVGSAAAESIDLAKTDRDNAAQHAKRAAELYAAGDFAAALLEFERSRSIVAEPALDYNIARCLDRLERPLEAAAAYERYVAARPDDPRSKEIAERAAVLRARTAAPQPVVVAPARTIAAQRTIAARPTIAAQSSVAARPSVAAPAALSALTGASAIVGAALLGHVGATLSGDASHSQRASTVATLRHEADAGYAMMAVAGVVAAVDVVLWIRWAKHRHDAP
jgi:tetratricopeptide (TPR) repeat protein